MSRLSTVEAVAAALESKVKALEQRIEQLFSELELKVEPPPQQSQSDESAQQTAE